MLQLSRDRKDTSYSSVLSLKEAWEVWQLLLDHTEPVHNLETFGPVEHDTVVIVVQVRQR